MAWPAAERTMQRPKTSSRFSILLLPLYTLCCLVLLCTADRSSDAAALLALKRNLTSVSLTTWNASAMTSVCTTWKGVGCNGTAADGTSQRVISLRLPGKSLYGPIPLGTIGSLHALDTLSLRSNKLTGSLPADLANCALLRALYLQDNGFSGPLPSDFSAWPLLQQLDLSSNSFNGSIPSSIGNLTRLKSLFLQKNSLSGAIPPLNVPSLQNFSVANNLLSGSIPSSLARFPASSFADNQQLCGPPSSNDCPVSPISSPPPPPNAAASSSKSNLSGGAIAGIVIGAIAFLVVVTLVLWISLRRKAQGSSGDNKDLYAAGRDEFERAREGTAMPGSAANGTNSVAGGGTPMAAAAAAKKEQEEKNKLVFVDKSGKQTFDLEDLLRASAEVLGKGSLGTAYKAMLDNGLVVAVKRLRDVTSDQEDYTARMEMLGGLRHENLVPLRAYYFAKQEKLLVFDYMPNGSLSALLHGNKGSARGMLDWESRLHIAGAVASGVEYLHSQGVVHGNIKSANVLLSRDNRACLSDYGLVQLVTVSPGPASHKSVGYVAPEVTDVRKVTPKGDVYSFGVLLLELLTGRSPSQAAASEDGVDLPRWVQSVVREEWASEVFDLQVMKLEHVQEEMRRLLQVALPCVATSPDQRPAIADVALLIRDLRKPPFLGGDDDVEPHHQYPGRRPPSDDVDLVSPYHHHQYPGRFSEITSDL